MEDVKQSQGAVTYPDPPQNFGSAPLSILVALFERLQIERKQDRRKRLLAGWFNKDRERATYGLKEKTLARTYIKLIPLNKNDNDAHRLLNWKRPTERNKSSGDFSSVLFEVVSKRSSVIEGSLSIDDLNNLLDELSQKKDFEDCARTMQRVYNRATPEEQRWIVRIILKDMVISVKETTVFSVFHPDAQDLYNTCSDLKKVAWELCDPARRLGAEDKAIQLAHAFAPMLCKRPTKAIDGTVKEMHGSEFFIEEKLDGERMQLHINEKREFFYWSRKGKDYTYLYGNHDKEGSLTPYIARAFDSRIKNIILDGEMLVWDPDSSAYLPFGNLKTAALDTIVKNSRDDKKKPHPCFKVFDLLYLNDQSLISKSLLMRKKNLRACVTPNNHISFAEECRGKTVQDVKNQMNKVLENRGEGLVIKHPASQYVLNGRNMDWIKVKPEYLDNLGETVDVLVVAGNYGSGSRGGKVSTLVCALADDRVTNGERKFTTFVRIGTGLTYSDYLWIREKPWKPWDSKNPPAFLQTTKRSREDKGDVYLLPEESFILKVKAAELVESDQYHSGFTMRFPRALSIRHDLEEDDCMPFTAVRDMLESKNSKSGHKRLNDEHEESLPAKKKRKITAKKPEVIAGSTGQKLDKVAVVSDLFEGTTFVVLPDPSSKNQDQEKKELCALIKAHGGVLANLARQQSPIFIVYGGSKRYLEIVNYIKKGVYDIIKPDWVKDSVALGGWAPLRKSYFFHATSLRAESDEYNENSASDNESPAAERLEPVKSEADDISPVGVKEERIVDPALLDWFQVGTTDADDKHSKPSTDDDSATDYDSDNADVADNDPDDEWDIKSEPDEQIPDEKSGEDASSTVKIGEDDTAMQYDQEHIFKHLSFYLDSPENAKRNGFSLKSKNEKAIQQSFDELAQLIEGSGGKIVDLDEARLTHIVIDKRDDSRRVEFIRRTAQPKRRRLVISEYIQACLDEETLLDEEEFNPFFTIIYCSVYAAPNLGILASFHTFSTPSNSCLKPTSKKRVSPTSVCRARHTMDNTQDSPISQLLNTLGITREDLNRRSDQMRQFLTSEHATGSRVSAHASTSSTSSDTQPLSRTSSSAVISTRHISCESPTSPRDASPTTSVTTPVKSEPEDDDVLPTRPLDNMEMVLERQRLRRRQKRVQRQESVGPSTSDSEPIAGPSHHASDNPDEQYEQTGLDLPPITPSRSKHYREHTSYASGPIKEESPSPTRPATQQSGKPANAFPHLYAALMQGQFQFRSAPPGLSSKFETPQKPRPSKATAAASSPLPPSSPPAASSPVSSPVMQRVLNYVSSPGLGDDLAEEDRKEPPYKLPPGPYSHQRPHHSYAGLIGQAILSSREHRLTLQEIYEWIATVHPHFKRGERTWMNSIRHVLSTTIHFRKITRERSAGRSHWAIFDEDLDCFVDGGYRKPGTQPKRLGLMRPKPRKRSAEEMEDDQGANATVGGPMVPRTAKRLKPDALLVTDPQPGPSRPPGLLPALVHHSVHSMRTPVQATPQQQSYYDSCVVNNTLPTFGAVLPALATPYRLVTTSTVASSPIQPPPPTSSPVADRSSSPISPSSPPDLTPQVGSSSPSEGEPLPESVAAEDAACVVTEQDEEAVVGSLLGPVEFLDKPREIIHALPTSQLLQPGINLDGSEDEDEVPLMALANKNSSSFPPLVRRKTAAAARQRTKGKNKKGKARVVIPSTPPRARRAFSPDRSPLSNKGAASSPFRTPGGHGLFGLSPFRTPGGSRGNGILDPHDPSALLDAELRNFKSLGQDSPAGLFGKDNLYTSPNPIDGSPGKYARWW
ncbi:unnamed protein product [Mycena citricolor]|uniref:DNA ligase n=1 Tax=Mycena citricolor TaxID=2018698 RepID=A0AAD2HFR7_9AGAR|nr:unnamed protein product [Mycena citricolor]